MGRICEFNQLITETVAQGLGGGRAVVVGRHSQRLQRRGEAVRGNRFKNQTKIIHFLLFPASRPSNTPCLFLAPRSTLVDCSNVVIQWSRSMGRVSARFHGKTESTTPKPKNVSARKVAKLGKIKARCLSAGN